MSTLSLSLLSLAAILLLIGLRVPIGVAMGAVAFAGFCYLRNFNVALSVLSDTPVVFAANWELSAIPMFLLMGAIAGMIPGLLTAAVYMIMIMVRCSLDPSLAPKVEFPDRDALWRERWDSLKGIWPVLVLIIGVMGGLYAGVVTPTEGGAVGAFLAAIIGVLQRQLSLDGFIEALKDAITTTAQLFFVGIGAVIFT